MPAAQELGHRLFYDSRFSGSSLQVDALRRPVSQMRAPKGQPINLACVSCHDPGPRRRGRQLGARHMSRSGAGMADTNALSSFNTAHYTLPFWNGRVDSLWAQAAVASEGALMNGNRLQTAWLLATSYRAEYEAVFSDHPVPDHRHPGRGAGAGRDRRNARRTVQADPELSRGLSAGQGRQRRRQPVAGPPSR